MQIGDEVLIFGGVSHFQHGRVVRIDQYERPFALIALRRKDGKIGKKATLVPVSRCHYLPEETVKKYEAQEMEWKAHRRLG